MKNIWWFNPGKLILFFVVPVYAFVIFVVPFAWPNLIVLRAGMYTQGALGLLGLVLLLGMGLFGLLGARIAVDSSQAESSFYVSPSLLTVMGSLTLLAYAIWFYPAFLSGVEAGDRTSLNQVPGVTSFSQLGVPFVVAYLSARLRGQQRLGHVVDTLFWLILLFTLVRVQLWSERLAMIELVAPITVLVMTQYSPRTGFVRGCYRVLGFAGPFLAIPVLLGVFTVTEFFQSWTVYSKTQNLPLLEFMTSRLVTYYFTALNNGAGFLATEQGRWPTFDFYYTMQWVYVLPFEIGSTLQIAVTGQTGAAHGAFLDSYADVEFNNMSGIFPIVYDSGYVGGFLYFCFFGFVAGVLYRSLVNGRALGLILYPPVFVACIEVLRVTYLNGSRAFLILIGSFVIYLQVRLTRARLVRWQDGEDAGVRSRARVVPRGH